ncbi:MAG: hypothetical protein KL785_05990 [Brevundimonas sp.]|nr:hypothetical protein [Brevundimonas sp.]
MIAGLAHAKEHFAEPKWQFGLGFENVTQETPMMLLSKEAISTFSQSTRSELAAYMFGLPIPSVAGLPEGSPLMTSTTWSI